jgi:hypothetical protein
MRLLIHGVSSPHRAAAVERRIGELGQPVALHSGKARGSAFMLFPDAVQREALKGVDARLRGLCGTVLR